MSLHVKEIDSIWIYTPIKLSMFSGTHQIFHNFSFAVAVQLILIQKFFLFISIISMYLFEMWLQIGTIIWPLAKGDKTINCGMYVRYRKEIGKIESNGKFSSWINISDLVVIVMKNTLWYIWYCVWRGW